MTLKENIETFPNYDNFYRANDQRIPKLTNRFILTHSMKFKL